MLHKLVMLVWNINAAASETLRLSQVCIAHSEPLGGMRAHLMVRALSGNICDHLQHQQTIFDE